MNETFSAGAFLFLERTLFKAHKSISLKLGAFWTQFTVGVMVSFAVNENH